MKNQQIYPCLWFDNQGKEAVDFYCRIFDNSKILENISLVTTFEIENVKFMALNGGPVFKANSAVSYYLYCENEEKITRIYTALTGEGNIMMPLDEYAWSKRYAWVVDRYGVNWQLDVGTIDSEQKIVPTLLFANEKLSLVKKAISFYCGVFSNSEIRFEAPYPPTANLPEGTLLFAQFGLNGFLFNATSSTQQHDFDFTEGNSFVVECESQERIDYYWNELTKEGEESMCGWLKDMFGVSWQIVPPSIGTLMNDPVKGPAVSQALMKMRKIDIRGLESAAGLDSR